MILEDGTAPAGANSYATEAMLSSYADDRSITLATSDAEAALVRATAAIEALYGSRYPGTRTNGRDQSLGWPRKNATDFEGETIAEDEIPQEIINAVCEAAIRELTEPGSMQPDLDRGGAIKRMKAGEVEIEYGSNAADTTTFSIIDGIMAPLLGGNASASLFAAAVRG